MKPKVLVCVLTGTERTNWINPVLALNLVLMARDPRFDVAVHPISDHRPVEYARNKAVSLARDMAADFLLCFDNDSYVDGNPLDVIAKMGAAQDVVSLKVGIGAAPACWYMPPDDNQGEIDGAFREDCVIGGAVLILRCTVWQRIPKGPWFKWVHAPNELCAPGDGGTDEIVHFVRLVQQHGLKVWTHRNVRAAHLVTVELGGVIDALNGLSQ